MSTDDKQVEAGQAVYTKRTLRAYDLVVLGLSNKFAWKCPTTRLLDHYNDHVTGNHLDIGVGSGFFLDRCRFPTDSPRLALMDLNADSLQYAARRASRYDPETFQRNVLEPFQLDCDKFDSVGLNYLLHCLPGTLRSKSLAMDHIKKHMNAGGVLFGATLLSTGVRRNVISKRLMSFYNSKGVFTNQEDRLEDLESALRDRFDDVQIEIVGSAALFSAR